MEDYLKKLKSKGLKLTPRRKAIFELFLDCNCHLTPDEVWKELQKQFTQCGLPSVYRNLESLVECRVLTRVQLFDGKKHYGLCTSQLRHHHHAVCLKCGKVEEVSNCALTNVKEIEGFQVINHFMQINGICPDCKQQDI